jgi:hypothetical protein
MTSQRGHRMNFHFIEAGPRRFSSADLREEDPKRKPAGSSFSQVGKQMTPAQIDESWKASIVRVCGHAREPAEERPRQ